ncbi:MAG: hypothetical protein Q8N23_18220 [Archangium sp.]|nr:hypothetical protein [Archangium sp.]MDP3574370.1 hypothetical protein [Archangium sp.]
MKQTTHGPWFGVVLFLALAPLVASAFSPAVITAAVLGAKLTDAERAKQKAEKKLEAFTKEYDPSKKGLARKGAELDKDVADLDKELDALAALDAAGAAELKIRRDAAVASAKQAVGGAEAGKLSEEFDKKLERAEKDFNPEKKNLLNVDPKNIEKSKKELDDLIAKLDGETKTSAQTRRDALFAKVESGVGDAKVGKLRKNIEAPAPVAPAAGVQAITPMKPTWCDGVLEAMGKNLDNYTAAIPKEWNGNPTEAILFSCLDPDWDVRQQVVAAWRQKVSNALGLSAAMNERLIKTAALVQKLDDDALKKAKQALCTTELAPRTEGTAEVRGNRALERMAVGCGNRLSDENRMELRDIDVPGGLTSQLATSMVVQRVLEQESTGGNASYQLSQASDVALLNAALVFDAAQFEQQLDALRLGPWGQQQAIVSYFGGKARLDGWVATLKALTSRVSGLQKVAFDAPAAAVKAFAARAAQEKPLLETMLSLEAQGDLKGCAEKLWPQVKAELKGQVKPSLEDVKLNPMLAYAVALCARKDRDVPGLEPIFTYYAERSPPVRGPMGAAYQGYFDAFNQLAGGGGGRGFQPGKREGSSETPAEVRPPERSPVDAAELPGSVFGHSNSMNPNGTLGGGVVKEVEKKGALVKLVFRTEKFKVPDYKCVETNIVDRITPEGQVVYRSNCTKIGEHEEESTMSPFETPSWAAEGVGPGTFVVESFAAEGRGWIIQAFDSKARGKRTSLFGVGL